MRIVLILLLLLGVGFVAMVAMNRPFSLPGRSAAGVTHIVSKLPKKCGFVMVADMRGYVDLAKKAQELKNSLRDSPESLQGIADLEANLGYKLEDLGRVVQPASFVAALPAPGASYLWGSPAAEENSELDGCRANLRNLGVTVEFYATDHSGRFPKSLRQITATYLKTIPTCPAAQKDTYSPSYVSASAPDVFTMFCSGKHHPKEPQDYPRYSPGEGLISQSEGQGRKDEEAQFIFGTAVNNEDLASDAVKQWTQKAGGFKPATVGGLQVWIKDGVYLGVSNGFVVGATTKAAMEELLKSMNGGENLASQPLYQQMRKELPTEVGGLFYLPLQGVSESIPAGDEKVHEALKGLQYWAATAEAKGGELVISSLLGIDNKNQSPFVKALLQSPNQPLYSADFVPTEWDYYTSLNARYLLALVLEGVKLVPEYRSYAAMGPSVIEAQLGISLENDLWTALTGEVGISGNTLEKLPEQVKGGQARAAGRGHAVTCMSNLKNYGTALEMYSTDNSGRYPTELNVLTPNYLKTLPTCPAARSDTYSQSYTSSVKPDVFTIFCAGKHHGPSGNYPQYTSVEGLIVGDAGEEAAPEQPVATPTTVLFFAVKDQAKAAELLKKVDARVGAPKATSNANVLRYEAAPIPVLRTLVAQPHPMLIVAVGPDAEAMLAQAMERKTPVSGTGEHKRAAANKPETWVSSSWVDLQPMISAFIPMVELDSDPERAKLVRKMLESMKDAKATSYFAVEPSGIRYLSQGNATWAAGAVGMAAAILVPNFVRARSHGQLTACSSNEKNIGTALEMYATDYSGQYPTGLNVLTPSYLKTIPTCPAASADTYSQSYQVSQGPNNYTFFCSGHHHAQAGTSPNYPQYTCELGLIQK